MDYKYGPTATAVWFFMTDGTDRLAHASGGLGSMTCDRLTTRVSSLQTVGYRFQPVVGIVHKVTHTTHQGEVTHSL